MTRTNQQLDELKTKYQIKVSNDALRRGLEHCDIETIVNWVSSDASGFEEATANSNFGQIAKRRVAADISSHIKPSIDAIVEVGRELKLDKAVIHGAEANILGSVVRRSSVEKTFG